MRNELSDNQIALISMVNADAERQGKELTVEKFVGGQRMDLWESAKGRLVVEGHRDNEIVVRNDERSRALAIRQDWGKLPSARLVEETIEILSCADYRYAFSEEKNTDVYWWDSVSPRVRISIEGSFSPEVKEFVEKFNPTSWGKACGNLGR